MEFPLLNITDQDWKLGRTDAKLIFDEFIYVGRVVFNDFHKDKFYCDCTGKVYRVVDIVLPNSCWRKLFGFLPMVYKSKLIFEETKLRLTVDQLRNFVIQRISELPDDEFNRKWIVQLKEATTHKEIIDGQMS